MTIASHIGQYRILRKIGAGGMGLVFLGEHTLLGRRAAIKTLLPTMSANREIVERFFNEARATSAISDPGVIQVFDFGYHVDGTAYIVMELLEGEALSARLDRLGKLSPGAALRVARQIAGSLAAAHACDIVHRDLKPDNIFLVVDGEAQGGERTKILDFGICKMGTGDPTLTQSGAMIGTPVYMSPEQCRGAGGVDQRSDIYAFGCLLFHMLTGRPPFEGDASGELIVAHLEEDPPAPSLFIAELPIAVDALVLRCLAKLPEDRYQSMTELQCVLGELAAELECQESTVAAVPPSMPLGRGFRSLYDGNFAAASGERLSPTHQPPWLRFALTPRTTPSPADSDDSGHFEAARPRRAALRAVLACVGVVGVVIGLVTTSFLVYSDDRGAEASDGPRIARPAERDPRTPATSEPPARTAVAASALPGPAVGAGRPTLDDPAEGPTGTAVEMAAGVARATGTAAGAPERTERDTQETLTGTTAGKDTAGKDTAGKDTAGKDTAGKDTAGKDTAGKDTAGKEIAKEARRSATATPRPSAPPRTTASPPQALVPPRPTAAPPTAPSSLPTAAPQPTAPQPAAPSLVAPPHASSPGSAAPQPPVVEDLYDTR